MTETEPNILTINIYNLHRESSQQRGFKGACAHIFNSGSTHVNAVFFLSLSLLTQNYVVLGLFYYPMFYLFSPLYLPLLYFAILPTTFIFSQKQSCTQALPQPSSSPFLLVSQKQASTIPKTFNPKKKKKKTQSSSCCLGAE